MQDHSKPPTSRRARLVAGALIGTVLSLGIGVGSASADTRPPAVEVVRQVESNAGKFVGGIVTALRSGIRW